MWFISLKYGYELLILIMKRWSFSLTQRSEFISLTHRSEFISLTHRNNFISVKHECESISLKYGCEVFSLMHEANSLIGSIKCEFISVQHGCEFTLCRYDELRGRLAAKLSTTLAGSRCWRFRDSRSSCQHLETVRRAIIEVKIKVSRYNLRIHLHFTIWFHCWQTLLITSMFD